MFFEECSKIFHGLIEYIRETMQMWFCERNVENEKCVTHLKLPLEKNMCMKYNESNEFEVNHVSQNMHRVGYNLEHHFMNLDEGKCTCKKFDFDMVSCAHTIAAIRFK